MSWPASGPWPGSGRPGRGGAPEAGPRALPDEEIPLAQALMRDPDVSTRQICERLEISKATLYRYVGPDGERRR